MQFIVPSKVAGYLAAEHENGDVLRTRRPIRSPAIALTPPRRHRPRVLRSRRLANSHSYDFFIHCSSPVVRRNEENSQ